MGCFFFVYCDSVYCSVLLRMCGVMKISSFVLLFWCEVLWNSMLILGMLFRFGILVMEFCFVILQMLFSIIVWLLLINIEVFSLCVLICGICLLLGVLMNFVRVFFFMLIFRQIWLFVVMVGVILSFSIVFLNCMVVVLLFVVLEVLF